jgi:hypothetical protein
VRQQCNTEQLYHSELILIDSFSGGGFEGDMIFPPNFDPRSMKRGAASLGFRRRWPQNTIPYDLSNLTSKFMPSLIVFDSTTMPYILFRSIAAVERSLVVSAMNGLMETVAITISTDGSKRLCIHFRPAQASNVNPLIVRYGTGCSGTVRNYRTWPVRFEH